MNKRKIVWEKWVDPLNTNIDEVEYPGYFDEDNPDNSQIEFLSSDPGFMDRLEDGEQSGYLEDSESHNRNITYNPMRIVSTPHGFVSLTEHSFASKHFDFWTMHYNSNITKNILDEIEKCDGVETISPLTRYRIRIGFNRMLIKSEAFNLTELKQNIEKKVLNIGRAKNDIENFSSLLMFTKDVKEKIQDITKEMFSVGNWAIYILPNGGIETVTCIGETEDFSKKIKFLEKIKEMVGGKLLVFTDKKNDVSKENN